MTTPDNRPDVSSRAPRAQRQPTAPLFTVRTQTLVGASLLTLLDLTLVSSALATQSATPALLAAGATLVWLAAAWLAWRPR